MHGLWESLCIQLLSHPPSETPPSEEALSWGRLWTQALQCEPHRPPAPWLPRVQRLVGHRAMCTVFCALGTPGKSARSDVGTCKRASDLSTAENLFGSRHCSNVGATRGSLQPQTIFQVPGWLMGFSTREQGVFTALRGTGLGHLRAPSRRGSWCGGWPSTSRCHLPVMSSLLKPFICR